MQINMTWTTSVERWSYVMLGFAMGAFVFGLLHRDAGIMWWSAVLVWLLYALKVVLTSEYVDEVSS